MADNGNPPDPPPAPGDEQPTKGRRRHAAFLKAQGLSVRAIARRLDVGQRTIFRWLKEKSFRDLEHHYRGVLFNEAVGKLCGLAGKAVDVLGGLLESPSESVRLKAATDVLKAALEIRTVAELALRLERIEADLGARGNGRRHQSRYNRHH